jgi:phosphoribosylformylglycinamidine cyclo-ligase
MRERGYKPIKESPVLDQVNYSALDQAKNAFIDASKRTMNYASKFGFVPDSRLGASANIFSLDLKPFLQNGAESLFITLIPEGLGTADDARPNDLSDEELVGFWHNIGIKTISALTNDAASAGMQTILMSLYLPSSSPEVVFNKNFLQGFLGGFVKACETVGCVWISGETPQLKEKIYPDKLDIAGALFGIVPPGKAPIDGTRLSAGDKIVFIGSSGPHENGFTTLRKLAQDLPQGYRTKLPDGNEFWQAINAPSILYTPLIQEILKSNIQVSSVENITGHGWQKLMRSKKPLQYLVENTLPVPPIFSFIEEATGASKLEMLKIFNYGVGCAIFVNGEDAAKEIVDIAKRMQYDAIVAGSVVASAKREVVVSPFDVLLSDETFTLKRE